MAKKNLRSLSFWLLAVPYVLIFYTALTLAIYLRYPQGLSAEAWKNHFSAFSVIFVPWLVTFYIHNLFEIIALRRLRVLLASLVSAMTVNLFTAVIYFYFQPRLILTPRRFLLLDITLSLALLIVWLLIVRYILKRYLLENVYLVGSEGAGLAEELHKYELLGFRIAGTIDEGDIEKITRLDNASVVIPDRVPAGSLLKQFYAMRGRTLNFYNYKDLYESVSRKIYLPALNELWFLENINYRDKRFYRFIKRLTDIVFGGFVFLLFCLSLPFVTFAIKAASAGPVFFTQQRVGKHGRIFKVYKYRTMVTGQFNPGNTWTDPNDPRITRVGRVLRRLRLDELPQCLNLIKGNMSLVGPRPEQPQIVEQLRREIPFYDERHLVKPGLTGWGQLNVYARTIEQSRLKLQYDLYYIKHRSAGFDMEIILKTMYHIITISGV